LFSYESFIQSIFGVLFEMTVSFSMLHNAMVATRFLMDDAVCLSGVDWLKTAMSFRLW
jgi:hypothetical protein